MKNNKKGSCSHPKLPLQKTPSMLLETSATAPPAPPPHHMITEENQH
jgi:hypothetical protein